MIDVGAVVERYGRHPRDVGSDVVQLALLDARIEELQENHLRRRPKDHQGGKALLKKKIKRGRLARRMSARDLDRFHVVSRADPKWKYRRWHREGPR